MSERVGYTPDHFRANRLPLTDTPEEQGVTKTKPIFVYSRLALGLATLAAVGLVMKHRGEEEEEPMGRGRHRAPRKQKKQPPATGRHAADGEHAQQSSEVKPKKRRLSDAALRAVEAKKEWAEKQREQEEL